MTRNVHREARTLFDQHVKPLLDEIRESQGEEDAEYFAGSIVYHLRGVFGWSVAYYSKADALHYWCMETDRDRNLSTTLRHLPSGISDSPPLSSSGSSVG